MACSSSSNTTYGLPSNGSPQSIDPRMTVRNPTGPGSANHVGSSSSSITRSEETTYAHTMQYVDIGTPNYAPASNHSRIDFTARADADPAPPTRGIYLPSFFHEGYSQHIEAAGDYPLASSPAGQENTIVVEFHWPGYMRYAVTITIACHGTVNGRAVRHHLPRSAFGHAIAQHAVRFMRMAQLESRAPPPVPLGTTSAPGVTTNDLYLRSLDPLVSPEGRVVWVPHFAARYPLGEGHIRPYCQRTRW